MTSDQQLSATEATLRRIIREEVERALKLSEPEQAVDVDAMARLLGASREKVYRMALSGEIPSFRVGRAWRFWPSEVRAHLSRPRDPWQQSTRSLSRRRGPRSPAIDPT